MKALYTISETQAETGLGRTKLYEEMAAGRLAFVHVGSRRLVPGEAISRFVARLESETRSQVDRILELVDADGQLDVEQLPGDATLADLRIAQRRLADRSAQPA